MKNDWRTRTSLLLGEEVINLLKNKHILIVGLGGVGAYVAEQLCRAGIGEMTIADADIVENTNRNRQLLALTTTIGRPKVEVMEERLLQINPEIKLHSICQFVRDEKAKKLLELYQYDYVVDAIDTLSPKVYLIYYALQRNLKVISAMGAGGKTDPSLIKVADIEKSTQCRLAHALRKRLHRLGIRSGFKVVFSTEVVPESAVVINDDLQMNKLSTVGTVSYMPALFGCFMAAEVIKGLRD